MGDHSIYFLHYYIRSFRENLAFNGSTTKHVRSTWRPMLNDKRPSWRFHGKGGVRIPHPQPRHIKRYNP